MTAQTKLEAVQPSDNPDFTRLKSAIANVELNPIVTDMTDRSILEHVIAAEQELDAEIAARATVERRKDLTTHHYQIRRGKLREMMKIISDEIDAEEAAAMHDIERRIRVLNLAVDAKRAAISVLKNSRPASE